MFQFAGFPSAAYWDIPAPVHQRIHGVFPCGFPHSDICGSPDICSSPQLFAACHVFLRLPVPRHPPCALSCLTSSSIPPPYSVTAGWPRPVLPRAPSSSSWRSCLSSSAVPPGLPPRLCRSFSLLIFFSDVFSLPWPPLPVPASAAPSAPPWLDIFDSQYSVFKVRPSSSGRPLPCLSLRAWVGLSPKQMLYGNAPCLSLWA